jgi:HAD superfamily hydrolase (TIGR01549 family)
MTEKIAAFDLDGTLVDSHEQIQACLEKTFLELLGIQLQPELVFMNLGQPIDKILGSLHLDQEMLDKVIASFRVSLQKEILKGNKVFPGALRTIKNLVQKEYQIAIATSKPTYLAQSVVQNSQLSGLISCIQGTDNFPSKPNPEILFRIERRLSGKILIMFGDRTEDMQAAKSFGCLGIGVANSAHSRSDLAKSGADYAFDSFDELINSNLIELKL